jgi:hypothetical protein
LRGLVGLRGLGRLRGRGILGPNGQDRNEHGRAYTSRKRRFCHGHFPPVIPLPFPHRSRGCYQRMVPTRNPDPLQLEAVPLDCLATLKDLAHWDRQGVILPAYQGRWNVGWTKAGAMLPDRIDGKYWMYFLYRTGIVRFDRTDPRKVLSRTDTPVFAPEAEWEKAGQVPQRRLR